MQGATLNLTFTLLEKIISIHAPVQGATGKIVNEGLRFGISIHAPVQGATASHDGIDVRIVNFNPRTRAGCDPLYWNFLSMLENFNPRTRAGCDKRLGND